MKSKKEKILLSITKSKSPKNVDMAMVDDIKKLYSDYINLNEKYDVADWKGMEKRIKNLEDAIADLKADKVEASAEEELSAEDLREPIEEEDKTEMSNEVIGELMTQIEELKSKIVELSGEPATEGIEYNPEGRNFNSTIDLKKLSTKERAAYYINNK